MRNRALLLFAVMLALPVAAQPYRDPTLPAEERVRDLLSRMTEEEKFWQLFMIPGDLSGNRDRYDHGIFGFQVSTAGREADASGQMLDYSPGRSGYATAQAINEIQKYFIEQSRLGIPVIAFDEALHGLVRQGATAFPQAIALAATFDTSLVHRVSRAIATECHTRGIRQILSPVVNIASDVRWGRTEETYGEDPFLASLMGVAFVSEFERQGIITTPKHYLANVGDGGRDSYPIHFDERLLREIYLPPFEACFRFGGSRSVMTAYNSLDGTPCTANSWLLRDILKDEWGFEGFVISDAGATGGANVLHFTAADYPDATAKSITAGLDVIFQTSYDHYTLFMPPFTDGTIDPAVIDEAVARVLKAKFNLGLFENPYTDPAMAEEWNGHPSHRLVAKEAALKSVVLLKNDRGVLPLGSKIRSVTVTGPDAAEARLGGYSGPGISPVSILDGIRTRAGDSIKVNYTPGCSRTEEKFRVIGEEYLSCKEGNRQSSGLYGSYYSNVTLSGQPVFSRVDKQVDFRWTLFGPDPDRMPYDFWSVKWTGEITGPANGKVNIGIDGNDGYRLFIDDSLLIDNIIIRGRQTLTAPWIFEKGKKYRIRIEYHEPSGNSFFRLVWDAGIADETVEIEKAVAMASESDVTVVVAGIEEGEFQDRALLGLPGRQEELIRRLAATGRPVVVVITGGSAVTMSGWLPYASGVIDAWYPGEEGGNAVAEVLFGDYNPAGRLPVTFPVHEGQLPLVYNHKPTGRGDDYVNLTGQPLFPFGFGLSYTTFEYGNLELSDSLISAGDSLTVSCTVRNTGDRAGDEVVQLYLRDELASVSRPVRELKGFRRISLGAGESARVSFVLTPAEMEMYDKEMKRTIEPGDFRIMIGSSSKDIRLRTVFTVREESRH